MVRLHHAAQTCERTREYIDILGKDLNMDNRTYGLRCKTLPIAAFMQKARVINYLGIQ